MVGHGAYSRWQSKRRARGQCKQSHKNRHHVLPSELEIEGSGAGRVIWLEFVDEQTAGNDNVNRRTRIGPCPTFRRLGPELCTGELSVTYGPDQ